ncbi:hypothetical protein [Paracoccus sp. (in: a-proteobacteria)]|nr:hypothetical protein [Paracoccus sp. (in: a-proteobacteria)]
MLNKVINELGHLIMMLIRRSQFISFAQDWLVERIGIRISMGGKGC